MPGTKIIMEGVADGATDAVVRALVRTLGFSDALMRQVISAAPCVILDGLTPGQAQAIHHALFPVHQAGANIQISNSPDGTVAKINWPERLKIHGRELSDFTSPPAGGTFACPCCGAMISVSAASQASAAAPARLAGAPPPSAAAPAAAARDAPALPATIPTPANIKNVQPDDPEGRVTLDDLGDLEEIALTGGADSSGTATPAAKPASSGALPEVPRIEPVESSAKAADPLQMDSATSGSGLNRSGPMALEDFEKGLAMDLGSSPFDEDDALAELEAGLPDLGAPSGGDLRKEPEPSLPPPQPISSSRSRAASGKVGTGKRKRPVSGGRPTAGGGGGSGYSVFVGKSKNPRMIALLSEIMGITADQAKRIARKPVIPVAKNIAKADAESIREKFAEANISARVTSKS